jgi:triacylglycerol esterase/lipase EstA (alpha/beta hydrolase family)
MKKALLSIIVCLCLALPLSLSFGGTAQAYDPVVFVHGYSGSTIVNFSAMIGWFKNDGYPSNHLKYYTYNSLKGVKAGAYTLRDKVNEELRATGKSKVDLVCHSMGGLVARYYMKYLGGAAKVDQVVCIATPHQGTYWAYADWFTQACKDMRFNSSLLQSIAGYYPGKTLWSSCDEIVIPNSSAAVGYNECIGCWEHIASTWSWNVYTKTRDYIKP